MTIGNFPTTRLRRTRMKPWCRDLVAEHRLDVSDLVWPVFVHEGAEKIPVDSMPGVFRLSLAALAAEAKAAAALGIRAMAIFPVIDASLKSPYGDEALHPKNLVCRAIAAIKNAAPEMGIIADVALDPYTTHGHDGVVENGVVANDITVEILTKQAVVLANAGADVVAPSDMMDGRVGAIRAALEKEKLHDTLILSYAAKYASHFYGPFRDAVDSANNLGGSDKKNYQMNPANADEAMREIALDIAEGADMVMVKPGIAYLDIVQRAANCFEVPVFAYQVSGEYAMIKAAAEKGWVNGDAVMMESLLAFKRAGARAVFTYAAIDIAKKLTQ